MIDPLILSISLLYLALSLIQYFIAPKIGPNPYLGFRIGYTFADRETWYKANKFMGKLMILHSLFLLPLCLIPNFLVPFIIIFVVPLILFIPIGIKYSSHILEIRGSTVSKFARRRIEPIKIGPVWSISPIFLYSILLAFMLVTYPNLPNKIAVHFDLSGNPNGWSSKDDFFINFSLFSLIFPAISYIFIFLGKKYPIYTHPGKMRFPRDTILKTIIISMDSALILLIFVYYSIYLYATKNIFVSNYVIMTFIILVVSLPLVYLFYKWKKGGSNVY